MRDFRKQLDVRLMAGSAILLLVVGGGLIYLLYGPGAAVLGWICLLGGLLPAGLLWLILKGLEWWGRRSGQW